MNQVLVFDPPYIDQNTKITYITFYFPAPQSSWNYHIRRDISIGFNMCGQHSPGIGFNMLNNLLLKYYFDEDSYINTSLETLPIIEGESLFEAQFQGLLSSLFLMIAFSFLPISSVYNIVYDRFKLTKYQQKWLVELVFLLIDMGR